MQRSVVVVGVGQVSNKDPDRIVHPVELLEEAARLAVDDAGADLLPHVGSVQSAPLSVFGNEHGGEMVAERLGLPPGRRDEWKYSGAAPQTHLAEAARQIAAGEIEAALVIGGIADASVRNARLQGFEPPAPPTSMWSQGSSGVDLPFDKRWTRPFMAEVAAGAGLPASQFALVESAMAAAAGDDPVTRRHRLGRLLAPFTEVAAARPDRAWQPQVRTADEIATPTADNRLVAEPYTKLMCSFPTIDLAAALLVCSTELADRLGVAADRRVHPWTIASCSEAGTPADRADIGRSVALRRAAERALAGAGGREVDVFDLYSCFPAAVQLALDALGLAHDDPRPFTLTGGLPYFGGPGASYTVHSMATAVERCRAEPDLLACVVGLGGTVANFSVGLWSAEPPATPFAAVVEPDVACAVEVAPTASGPAVVEAFTVLHERDRGPVAAPVIARLPDGRRVGARAAHPELPAAISGTDLVGTSIRLTTDDDHVGYVLA